MYLNFYGLEKKPFNPTPDPKFLYLTPSHREALAQILYGVQEGKGFIVLTGEVGTGKTTLIQTLLRRLDEKTEVAYIFNSKLPFDALVEYMLRDFGITENLTTVSQRLFALNNFLIERRRLGQNTVLIIDEAQNLDPPALEQVRLLSNFETATEKLLQIFLAGQPELQSKLDLPELRQLKQRISLRCVIRPLTAEETRDYIQHRLRIAGGRRSDIFTDKAVDRITRYAGGIPRLVNIVCDHALLFGYAEQRRRIDEDTIQQVIAYIEQGERPEHQAKPKWNRSNRSGWSMVKGPFHWISGALATLLLLVFIFLALRFNAMEDFSTQVESYIVEVLRSVFSLFAMFV
ncbi:MAG TPA: AAA family ATPase [Verrucomicrobiae bacterium]|jgi:general secretion pathway protein A|nr:AAA family ATPase [Verrucomicrobiae bacterium]